MSEPFVLLSKHTAFRQANGNLILHKAESIMHKKRLTLDQVVDKNRNIQDEGQTVDSVPDELVEP
jgi:hypothetical protein